MANQWPSTTGAVANPAPKHVFSRSLARSDWNNTPIHHEDATASVARLKHDTANNIFLFGRADLAASLNQHGVIDPVPHGVEPGILDGGTPRFKRGETGLKLLDSRALSSGIVMLRYAPRG